MRACPGPPATVEETIFDALIAAREKFGDKEILEDIDRKPMTYTGLIRAAFVLGRKIADMTEPGERVGHTAAVQLRRGGHLLRPARLSAACR